MYDLNYTLFVMILQGVKGCHFSSFQTKFAYIFVQHSIHLVYSARHFVQFAYLARIRKSIAYADFGGGFTYLRSAVTGKKG